MTGLTWLTPAELSTTIVKAIRSKKPLSMVRLGDGEYEIMKHLSGKVTREVFYSRFARWFGKQKIKYDQMCALSIEVQDAFVNCDLIGIPCITEVRRYPKWNAIETFMRDRNIYPKPAFYFYDIYTLWRDFDTFKHILQDRKELHVITSRNVKEGLQNRFGIGCVNEFLLKPEYFLWKGKDSGVEKFITQYEGPDHYPDMYNMIKEWIADNAPLDGKLFLVGAGALGKIYCMWIRDAGGMALDVGAMFDGWAGVTTRPYLQRSEIFRL